jgi:TPR repeat protein
VCYDYGTGVAKDEKKAVEYYLLAAQQNHIKAQYNLGVCYDYGNGVVKDEKKAIEYYQLAAHQNDTGAQFSLAILFKKHGDYLNSVVWYSKCDPQKAIKLMSEHPEYFMFVCQKTKELEKEVETLKETIIELEVRPGPEYLKAMERFNHNKDIKL